MRYDDFVTKKKGFLLSYETLETVKKSNNQFTIDELESLLNKANEVGASRVEFDLISGEIRLNKQKIIEQEYACLDRQGYLADCNSAQENSK